MKFTPSSVSSSSVSSNTNSSFSENFYKSKGNTFGCFSGVLSRILCSKSLPTHPSDPIENFNQKKLSSKIEIDGSNTPNVVARLMGLDSMPEISMKYSQKMPNSVSRSKSMDSEDFREETEEIKGQHRRVKTSVSFRETPDFFELEDGDFFVLSFENGGKKKKNGSNLGNFDVGIKGKKHRRRKEKCGRKQRRNRDEQSKERVFSNEERLTLKISPQNSPKIDAFFDVQKQSYHLSPLKDKFCSKEEEFDGIKARKKKRKEICFGESKDDEVECDSDNSSPVSVLDHNTDFISDPEVTTTSEEDARLGGSESVSKSYTSQSNESDKEHARETCGNEAISVGLKRKEYKKHENIEMLKRVCKLAEVEVRNSNWKYRRMLRDDELQDIAKDFGQRIFNQLVSELIDQLVGFECQEI
ncbi:hypothetical protein BVRB_7g171980 [Beta vulgaris subsp. vulgaris]|uniref:uncharacterized protein LOC104899941 n=1 Tax=Beta vulgaris subsp. vulgaris TaxID=3555 RepID=UPI00053F9538|nr:uncharacterized protein LOC104899941 [Beta vulgaris subsp. vulgaris]KMT05038.1 hypothetical protein BVRB_7g171980 [Beta vulgaris subsp. vulgaris]